MMYAKRITNCAFLARHGLFAAEVTLGQRFHVDALLEAPVRGVLDYVEVMVVRPQ